LDEVPLPLLLPSIGTDGKNRHRPSVAIMTVKDATNLVAPKLSQDEDIYAIGLAEAAAGEFFGPAVAEFVRGEGILSTQSAELVLGALRSGALGRNDILSGEAVMQVIGFTGTILSSSRGSNTKSLALEDALSEAVSNLDKMERARLDAIVTELTQRSMQRAVDRLSGVNRLI
jgi:hypothetical protein